MERVKGITDTSNLEDFEVRFRVAAVVMMSERINNQSKKPHDIFGTPVKYREDGRVDSIGPVQLHYGPEGDIISLGKHAPPKRGYNREVLPEIMTLNEKFELFGLGAYVEMINVRDPKCIGALDHGYAVEYDAQDRIVRYGEVDIIYEGDSKIPIKVGTLADKWGFW